MHEISKNADYISTSVLDLYILGIDFVAGLFLNISHLKKIMAHSKLMAHSKQTLTVWELLTNWTNGIVPGSGSWLTASYSTWLENGRLKMTDKKGWQKWLKKHDNNHKRWLWISGGSILGPVLAQGSTATGSLTRRVKPIRLTRPGKMGMTTSTIIVKNGSYMQSMYGQNAQSYRCFQSPPRESYLFLSRK